MRVNTSTNQAHIEDFRINQNSQQASLWECLTEINDGNCLFVSVSKPKYSTEFGLGLLTSLLTAATSTNTGYFQQGTVLEEGLGTSV